MVKIRKFDIKLYCKCDICKDYFEIEHKRSRFCSNKCRQKNYRNEKNI